MAWEQEAQVAGWMGELGQVRLSLGEMELSSDGSADYHKGLG